MQDEVDVLDRAGRTQLCKDIYMGITGLSEERSRGFFQMKARAARRPRPPTAAPPRPRTLYAPPPSSPPRRVRVSRESRRPVRARVPQGWAKEFTSAEVAAGSLPRLRGL